MESFRPSWHKTQAKSTAVDSIPGTGPLTSAAARPSTTEPGSVCSVQCSSELAALPSEGYLSRPLWLLRNWRTHFAGVGFLGAAAAAVGDDQVGAQAASAHLGAGQAEQAG
jgi:hypothetical protein